jgi:ribonucleoside-triphosphate reductase
MFKYIKKRDGRLEEFNSSKITEAIRKAGVATGELDEKDAKRLTLKVIPLAKKLCIESVPYVEEIQDVVETVLLNAPYYTTAKAYILYREHHHQIRNLTAKENIDMMMNYISKKDWKVKENSNMSYSLQGLNNYISSHITKEYWLNKIYSSAIREVHENGDIHIHDLGLLAVYCVGWDLQDILLKGFRGVEGKVESSPPKHFRSALGQIVNFFYTLQGEAAGAQALSNFDTLLAPFIRYDNLKYKEVKQAIQEFIFNINIPTRVGFQTPFTNITMDLNVPPMLKDSPAVIGGAYKKDTYAAFQKEMNMLNRAFAEIMMEGDAKGRVFTFPIPTYNITKDFDWTNPDLDNIWKMTGKYGIPYFSNFVNSDMSPEDARSMCCRLRLDNRKLRKRTGGLFSASPLTGSIGVVTINLPRLGYLAKNEDDFFNRLDKLIDYSAESLNIKRKFIERFTEDDFYPYSKFYLRKIKDRMDSYWVNHFSTIGIIGMNETCLNFIGKDISTQEGISFSEKVMDHILYKIENLQEKYNEIFNLEATPAESTTYRFAIMDKEKFKDIICANEEGYKNGGEPFYTNSSHLPVNYTDDIFESLEHQDRFQTRYTGGTVLHFYLNEKIDYIETVKDLIRIISEDFKLPYFTLSPTFSICPSHGYLNGVRKKCITCEADTEVYSRVVGYLRPISQWNKGKKSEFNMRKNFVHGVHK